MKRTYLVLICSLLIAYIGEAESETHSLRKALKTKKRNTDEGPTSDCESGNEGSVYPMPVHGDEIWVCKSGEWIPYDLLPSLGKSQSLPGKSCKHIRDTISNNCAQPPQNGAYWVKVLDPCSGEEQTMKVYCDMTTDNGGWSLVWKHSYVEVNPRTTDMFWHSDYYKPCLDLSGGSNGWCNVPMKIRFNPEEMIIVAYHNGVMVYAYKGYFNRNIDYHWTGATLLQPTMIVDQCTQSESQGVAPYPQKEYDAITGLALAKYPASGSTDTIDGTGTDDDRWLQCRLPSSISSSANNVQMTVAILVR